MRWLWRSEGCRADEQGPPGVEGDALALGLGGGMTVSIVAHGTQTAWQDVAEVAFDELAAWDGVDARSIAVSAVLPAEADMAVGDGNDAGVADGGATDISSEIFDYVFTTAEGLKMNPPVLLPNSGIHVGQVMLAGELGKSVAEASAEDASQCRLGHEEVAIFYSHHAACGIDPRTRHDGVDMRMKMQSLVPRVEDHGEAAGGGSEPVRSGQDV